MTENPTRKKNTGESGNGGQFGSQTRPEADSLLAPPVNHRTTESELKAGDIIIGESGGRTVIQSATPSEVFPCCVNPELGFLQIGETDLTTIATDTERTTTLGSPPVEQQKELDDAVLARFPEAEPALHSGVVANPSHPLQHQEVAKIHYTFAIEGTPTIGAGRIGPELVWNNGARRKFRSHQITEARKELNRIDHLPALGATASAEQRRNRRDRAYEAQTQLGLAVREFVRGYGGDVGVIGLAT